MPALSQNPGRHAMPAPPAVKPMTDTPATPHTDENFLIAERRAKLAQLRQGGVAFPNDFKRADYAGDVQAAFTDAEHWTADAFDAEPRRVALGGRVMLKRDMGKAGFAQVQDESGRIQLWLKKDLLGDAFEVFKNLDLGDIVAVEG
jgi:lysyl-tRNA synthetase class 2